MNFLKLLIVLVGIALIALVFIGTGKKEVVYTDKAPKPIGPYSQAIKSDGYLFVSGQIALKMDGSMDTSSIENECRQVLNNVKSIVEAAGFTMDDVVKASVYMTDLKQFAKLNEVYGSYFSSKPPARETVEVKALPKGAHVEISVIAN